MGKPPLHRSSPSATRATSPGLPTQSSQRALSSNSSTGSAPSSVMCAAFPLTRELSDLSGSYMNGNTAPRSSLNRSFGNSFGNSVSSEEPVQGFWHQAYILSTPCPREPTTGSSSPARQSAAPTALIVVERNGVIELVKKSDEGSACDDEEDADKSIISQHDKDIRNGDSSISLDADLVFLSHNAAASLLLPPNQRGNDESSSRIPILILLMDPGLKQYELMQLWVDPRTDLVRDVLHALQRKLPDKWRQDYDGLFQFRGNQFCQLLHILSIAKYDVRPRELWVAKPWSMAAKPTTELANDCIRQLRAGGLLSTYAPSSSGKSRMKYFLRSGRNSPVSEEEGPLTLSEEALKLLYVPDGIMRHHHACQFLSFRLPPIPARVLGQADVAHNSRVLGTSQSFDDVSSQLTNPSDVMMSPGTGEAHAPSNKGSSTASSSPSRSHSYSRQNHLPTPVNLNSRWHTTLEVVGEVKGGSGRDLAPSVEAEEAPNVSVILADLVHKADLKHRKHQEASSYDEPDVASKKEQRCSLRNLLAPLNCAKRRSLGGGGGKVEDGHSSSRGGDGSSSGKNSKNSSQNNDNNGRDTPTSKGSREEDGSIISDSAPLLNRGPETSSVCSSVSNPPPEQSRLKLLKAYSSPRAVNASPFSLYNRAEF